MGADVWRCVWLRRVLIFTVSSSRRKRRRVALKNCSCSCCSFSRFSIFLFLQRFGMQFSLITSSAYLVWLYVTIYYLKRDTTERLQLRTATVRWHRDRHFHTKINFNPKTAESAQFARVRHRKCWKREANSQNRKLAQRVEWIVYKRKVVPLPLKSICKCFYLGEQVHLWCS